MACGSKHGQQLIARCRNGHALTLCQIDEEHAEEHEQQVGRHESEPVGTHVLLCLAQRLACEVLLHHVLVETCHHDNYEHTAEKLLPEVLAAHPIVEDKHLAVAVFPHRPYGLAGSHAQSRHHIIYNKDESREHAGGLESVRPHQCLYSAATGVKPNQRHHGQDREPEWHAYAVEHKPL